MTDTTLLPCPLCGESKGYLLDEGSTYRWWSVKCAACGQEVSEARATYPAETTPRTANADAAWNDAGKHAQALRDTIKHQDAELRRLAAVETERDQERTARQEAQRQLYAERERLYKLVSDEQVKASRLRAEIEALRRGEFICGKCGLRKDADAAGPAQF